MVEEGAPAAGRSTALRWLWNKSSQDWRGGVGTAGASVPKNHAGQGRQAPGLTWAQVLFERKRFVCIPLWAVEEEQNPRIQAARTGRSHSSWCWWTGVCQVRGQGSFLPGHFSPLQAQFCWPAFQRCCFHLLAAFDTCPHCQQFQDPV